MRKDKNGVERDSEMGKLNSCLIKHILFPFNTIPIFQLEVFCRTGSWNKGFRKLWLHF